MINTKEGRKYMKTCKNCTVDNKCLCAEVDKWVEDIKDLPREDKTLDSPEKITLRQVQE